MEVCFSVYIIMVPGTESNRYGRSLSEFLSPLRLPVPHLGENTKVGDTRIELGIKVLQDLCLTRLAMSLKNGAENEIRTRDPHLGKVVLYH